MIRTKLPKILITEQKIKQPSGQMGGHMPNPPEDCIAPVGVKDKGGTIWVDNAFCVTCKNKKTCWRRKEFEREWKTYRAGLKNEHPTRS